MELWLHVCQFRYICLQQSDTEIKATYQLKQQIMIRFLSFGVLIKSNVPYLRVSSLLTSAFLTSVITCFRCWESISTPFLAAYFMSRLWASSRRLLARSHRGDSGIHLREIKKQRLILNKGTSKRLFFQIYWQWRHLGFAKKVRLGNPPRSFSISIITFPFDRVIAYLRSWENFHL